MRLGIHDLKTMIQFFSHENDGDLPARQSNSIERSNSACNCIICTIQNNLSSKGIDNNDIADVDTLLTESELIVEMKQNTADDMKMGDMNRFHKLLEGCRKTLKTFCNAMSNKLNGDTHGAHYFSVLSIVN